MTRKPSPSRRLVVNVEGLSGSAKGLMTFFRIENTATGVQIIIEPPLANFILDPVLDNKEAISSGMDIVTIQQRGL